MSFEFVEEYEKPADYGGICPACGDHLTFIHDLRCQECDQQFILWCPTCERHLKLKLKLKLEET
jgi:predicted amidophosphoribosyltransferase